MKNIRTRTALGMLILHMPKMASVMNRGRKQPPRYITLLPMMASLMLSALAMKLYPMFATGIRKNIIVRLTSKCLCQISA